MHSVVVQTDDIFDRDSVAVADSGEAEFSDEVNLPEVFGFRGLRASDGSDWGQVSTVETMFEEDVPVSSRVEFQFEMISASTPEQ